MAKITFPGISAYAKKLKLLEGSAVGVCKYALYPAAGIVLEAIKENTPVDTGDLRDSESLAPMEVEDGLIYTEVRFSGKDRKGVANALKARVLESGSSTRRKRPFIRPAVNRVKLAAEAAMEQALSEKIEELLAKKG